VLFRKSCCAATSRNAIIMANRQAGRRRRIPLLHLIAFLAIAHFARAQSPQTPAPGPGVAQLEANQQRKVGQVYYADGNVEIRYRGTRLQADHAEYNASTDDVVLSGHIQFDYLTEHLKADRAEYNLRTDRGRFDNVSGSLQIERKANPQLLVTPTPLSFEAASVERLNEGTYRIRNAKLTVCDPSHPTWTFGARRATLHVNQSVALLDTDFRLFRIPLIYLPYADVPNEKSRQSGFLMPELSKSSIKGTLVGDAYYWAPVSWADATVGAQYLSLRGWQLNDNVRMKPSENTTISGSYFGVIDKLHQGGSSANAQLNTQLGGNWHAAVNFNELTSLTFQEVFSPTFNEAVTSEVASTAFATKHFDGFNLGFDVHDYKNFLTAQPQTSINLRTLPAVRFGSEDRAPWKRWPLYLGLDAFTSGVHRSDPGETEPDGTIVPPVNTRALSIARSSRRASPFPFTGAIGSASRRPIRFKTPSTAHKTPTASPRTRLSGAM